MANRRMAGNGKRSEDDTPGADYFGQGEEAPNDGTLTGGKFTAPVPTNPIPAQSGETPRERADIGTGVGGNGEVTSAPRRPSAPTPMAGSAFEAPSGGAPNAMAMGSTGGVIPFNPLPQIPGVEASTPTARLRGLFGRQGGLQGGGLGTPFDPTPNEASDPISGLINMLKRRKGGLF